jgi:MFS family permease
MGVMPASPLSSEHTLNVSGQLPGASSGARTDSFLLSLNICLAICVFALDTFVPLGIATGMLYVTPVAWLALWSSKKEASLVVAAAGICTALSIVGFLMIPHGVVWIDAVNRAIAIFIIWMTAILSVLRKRAEEETKILRGLLPICSYCKKVRDDKGYWKQIEVYIAANSQADFSHGLCPECGLRHYPDVFKEQSKGQART